MGNTALEAENLELIQAVMTGYPQTLIPLMTADSKLYLIGSKMGGSFTLAEFSNVLGGLGSKLEVMPELVTDNIIASEDRVVVQSHGEGGLGAGGVEYNNTYCFIFRIDNGKIMDCFEYSDTALVDRIFFDDI